MKTSGREHAQIAGLATFRWLPGWLRRVGVRLATPNYTLGVVAVWTDEDTGRVLLVRSRHHEGWALPGGLVQRREVPLEAIVRELAEELSIDARDRVRPVPAPSLVDTGAQIVTMVFTGGHTVDSRADVEGHRFEPQPDLVEVTEVAWFDPGALPDVLVRGTAEAIALVVPPAAGM